MGREERRAAMGGSGGRRQEHTAAHSHLVVHHQARAVLGELQAAGARLQVARERKGHRAGAPLGGMCVAQRCGLAFFLTAPDMGARKVKARAREVVPAA